MTNKEYINNKYLKKDVVEKRTYQELLTASALDESILVVAPTGLGKTIIAILLISYKYKTDKNILFLSPTKPLISQHYNSLKKILNIDPSKIVLVTGSILPEKRKKIYNDKGLIICATPQTIRNDINNNYLKSEDFNILIFDEAHRAVGEYSYNEISSFFPNSIKRLALTASPGYNRSKIKGVADNLGISKVEIKTDDDIDVKDYIKDIEVDLKFIDLDPVSKKISSFIDEFILRKISILQKLNVKVSDNYSKKQLLEIQKSLFARIKGSKSPNKFNFIAISNIASLIKFLHAKELIESQGFYSFEKYLHKLIVVSKKKSSRATSQIVNSKEFSKILEVIHKEKNKEYSKIKELKTIVSDFITNNPSSKILVFNNYRANSTYISEELNKTKAVKAVRFIGQANKENDKGLSQKEQSKIISDFRENKYNVLVCTSVGEEGLDIPSVDLVVFYDAVASEIRQIQRRGRTGRFNSGKVIVLINKDTIDERYYYVSKNKEKKMKHVLKNFNKRKAIIKKKDPQKKLFDF